MAANDALGGEPGDAAEGSQAERRQKRLDALSALARQSGTVPSNAAEAAQSGAGLAPTPPRQTARRRGPARRMVVGLGLGALAVIVALGVVLRLALIPRATTTPASQRPSSVTITPRGDRLGCPVDIAWSPDGKRIAVLGYMSCNGGSPCWAT